MPVVWSWNHFKLSYSYDNSHWTMSIYQRICWQVEKHYPSQAYISPSTNNQKAGNFRCFQESFVVKTIFLQSLLIPTPFPLLKWLETDPRQLSSFRSWNLWIELMMMRILEHTYIYWQLTHAVLHNDIEDHIQFVLVRCFAILLGNIIQCHFDGSGYVWCPVPLDSRGNWLGIILLSKMKRMLWYEDYICIVENW